EQSPSVVRAAKRVETRFQRAVPNVGSNDQWFIGEHLLCLPLADAVLRLALPCVAGVPLKFLNRGQVDHIVYMPEIYNRPQPPTGRAARGLLGFRSPIRGPRMIPGELLPEPGDIELNAGLPRVTLTVANTGDRPIQVGSHYHFFETNPALSF